ncbi:hypothetical protein D3C80_1639500 [compost metagenome]
MTVGTQLDLLNVRHRILQELEDGSIFRGVQITDSIGNIDHIRSLADRHGHHFRHKITLGPSGILQGKLQLGKILFGVTDRRLCGFEHLGFFHTQLVLPVNRRGCQKNMNARVLRAFQCFSDRVNISLSGARKSDNSNILYCFRHGVDCCQIAR